MEKYKRNTRNQADIDNLTGRSKTKRSRTDGRDDLSFYINST